MLAWVIHIPVLSAIVTFYYKRRVRNKLLKRFFLPALLFKLLCGVVIGLLYTYYYRGGDTFALFSDASKLSGLLIKDPSSFFQFVLTHKCDTSIKFLSLSYIDQPRALFMVKILALISLLTFNNYWISGLWLSLFSFCGMWSLVKTLKYLFPNTSKAAVFSFLFLPSPVLFGSGVTKESICLGCIGFIVSYALLLTHRHSSFTNTNALLGYVFIFFYAFILLKIKFYIAAVLASILFIYAIIEASGLKKIKNYKKMGIFILIFFSFIILTYLIHPRLYTDIIPETVAASHNKILAESKNQNLTFHQPLNPSWKSILERVPSALAAGLFRPIIGEKGNVLMIFAEAENLFLMFLIITALPAVLFAAKGRVSFSFNSAACIAYIIFTALILGLTIPNVGTLFRHKSIFLPFLWLLVTQALPSLNIFQKKIPKTDDFQA